MDYQYIVENLKSELIVKMMRGFGVEPVTENDSYITFPTICHNHVDSNPSHKLYYYKNTKLFMCYTQCHGMSIFSFLKHYYETNEIEYDWRFDVYDVAKRCTDIGEGVFRRTPAAQAYASLKDRYNVRKAEVVLPYYNDGVMDTFSKQLPDAWEREGISRAAMIRFDIRFSIAQNKVIIPHYDVKGNLVGIRGRAFDPWEVQNIGKYMPVKVEGKWYSHPLGMNLYGLYENKKRIAEYGVVYVFEGEKSVLKLDDFSFPNLGVAVCGSTFNKYQLNILMKEVRPREIVLCFDKENDTEREKYFDKLKRIADKYKNYCKFSFIYDTKGLLDLKDSPVDKGEAVFRQLLNSRVKVK